VGTTITALLPVATRPPASASPVHERLELEARSGRLGTILVCDDDQAVRKLISDVISIGSYRVLEARDAAHALELAAAHPGKLDLLVTDIVMPSLSGPALASQLRALYPELLVLFVSGYADSESLASIVGEELLGKPFLPAALLRRVRQMLDARARLASSAESVRPPRQGTTG